MSQLSTIRLLLKSGPVCGTDLLKMKIPRYAARISELRAQGFDIITEPCDQHDWHQTRQVQYRITGGRLF